MQKKVLFIAMIVLSTAIFASAQSSSYQGKKILYINSYHEGYEWSDGILQGIQEVLVGTGIEFKKFDMDTKRNTSEEFILQAVLKAKAMIEEFKPDVVIASDDNAFKYVIMPYYRDKDLPVVFCGLNWDAAIYGAPYRNTTGMIETALVSELVKMLQYYTVGNKGVGYLAADVATARKEGEYYEKIYGADIKERYVKTYAQWKEEFLAIQDEADVLISGNIAGINDFDSDDAAAFVKNSTRIPTGTIYSFMMPYALIGFVKVEQEQGIWSAQAALKILDGQDPGSIPVVENKEGKLLINLNIAEKLNIVFSSSMLRNAEIIE